MATGNPWIDSIVGLKDGGSIQDAYSQLKAVGYPDSVINVILNDKGHEYGQVDKGYHVSGNGEIEKNMPIWKQALLAGAVVGGPALAGALLPGAAPTTAATQAGASAAGGGVGLGETGATVGLSGPVAGLPEVGVTATGAEAAGPMMSGAAGGGKAGSIIGKILGKVPGGVESMGDLAKMTGELENGEALNRYKKGELTQGYDRLMLDAAENRRKDVADANRNMAVGSYLSQGGSQAKLPSFMLNGQMRTPVDFGTMPRPATDAQKQQGDLLQAEMLKRLQPGGSYTPTDPGYLDRGKLEKAGQVGSILSGGVGILKDIFGK